MGPLSLSLSRALSLPLRAEDSNDVDRTEAARRRMNSSRRQDWRSRFYIAQLL